MFLNQLPRLSIPQSSSSLFSKLTKLNSIAQFSTTQIETSLLSPLIQETHIEVPKEKLFIPPDTDISAEDLSTRILKGSNIVLSKYAKGAQVIKAEFVKNSVETEQCPDNGLPEFALVGRSNVGKSSLLNSLVKRKKLALTSKKPKRECMTMNMRRAKQRLKQAGEFPQEMPRS